MRQRVHTHTSIHTHTYGVLTQTFPYNCLRWPSERVSQLAGLSQCGTHLLRAVLHLQRQQESEVCTASEQLPGTRLQLRLRLRNNPVCGSCLCCCAWASASARRLVPFSLFVSANAFDCRHMRRSCSSCVTTREFHVIFNIHFRVRNIN